MRPLAAMTHVNLTVSDLDRSVEWYRRVFDATVGADESTAPPTLGSLRYRSLFHSDPPSYLLGLMQRPDSDGHPFDHRWVDHFGLHVPERAPGRLGAAPRRPGGGLTPGSSRPSISYACDAIPPDDPAFADLFRRRNDAESINRALEDTLWLGRAHSLAHRRHLLNLLGYALMVNSLAVTRAKRRQQVAA